MKYKPIILLLSMCFFTLGITSCIKNDRKVKSNFPESANADENVHQVLARTTQINEYTLSDIRSYSEATQHLIFLQLTPDNRYRLVRERLADARENEADDNHRNLIAGLENLVTLSIYNPGGDKAAMERVEAYVESMIPALGYDYVKELVTRWGGTEDVASLGISGSLPGRTTGGGGTFRGEGPVTCNCSRSSDWCIPGFLCSADFCGNESGCGTLWGYDCNGMCQRSK